MAGPGAKPKPVGEKFVSVTVRLHPSHVQRLRALAAHLKCSQGEVVSAALVRMERKVLKS